MQSILDPICQWLKSNMDIVYFIYGLVFVVMGVSIWLQPKKGSRFKLSSMLWLLAAFGIIHGISEFLDMRAMIVGSNFFFNIARNLFLITSFIFLFEFGRRLIRICKQKYAKGIMKLFMWWLTPAIV